MTSPHGLQYYVQSRQTVGPLVHCAQQQCLNGLSGIHFITVIIINVII
jgi:hypothetical protein